jgi:hypothetical protein
MQSLFILLGAALVLSLVPLSWFALRAYRKYRGSGVLTCPETRAPVAVRLDARRVAWTELSGDRELRLESCSRWPERRDCGQECLEAVGEAPEDCLVRTILQKWYRGSSCALCGLEFSDIGWTDHRPALLAPDRRTLTWNEVAPEKLPELLETHGRVCWNCHVAESFRSDHPELVLDDPLHRASRRSQAS